MSRPRLALKQERPRRQVAEPLAPRPKKRRYEWSMAVDVTIETKVSVQPQAPRLTIVDEDE